LNLELSLLWNKLFEISCVFGKWIYNKFDLIFLFYIIF